MGGEGRGANLMEGKGSERRGKEIFYLNIHLVQKRECEGKGGMLIKNRFNSQGDERDYKINLPFCP